MGQAYKIVAPHNSVIMDFDTATKEQVLTLFDSLSPGDLVVLIQSSSFRLEEYRIRLRLFEKGWRGTVLIFTFAGIKNIEHVHLEYLSKDQYEPYVNALSFDPNGESDGKLGLKLKEILDKSSKTVVTCKGGTELVYGGKMVVVVEGHAYGQRNQPNSTLQSMKT